MSDVTKSPDDPIRSEEDDLLGRATFARALGDLITGALAGATLRIGVYGGWGEGKTSVLELIRAQLRNEGHVTIFLYAWASGSPESLLEHLLRELAHQLKIPSRLRFWNRFFALTRSVRNAASFDPRIKAADAVLGPAIEAVFGKMKRRETASVLELVRQRLGARKLVIFIDDLDRVEPSKIPGLLLTIREALNQPGYFYVLALAPEIVQAGLASTNSKWGDATKFLEKIVELPRLLPPLTAADLDRFIGAQIENLGIKTKLGEALRELHTILPANPRQVKAFLRYMASIQRLAFRFDADEIDFVLFTLCQLLRSEFPMEASRLLDDQEAMDDLAAGRFTPITAWDKSTTTDEPLPFQKYSPEAGGRRVRFERLCLEVRMRGLLLGSRLRSLFLMVDEPPVLTRKELSTLVERYRNAAMEQRAGMIASWSAPAGNVDQARVKALFDMTVEARGIILGEAVEEVAEERVIVRLAEVEVLDEMLSCLIVHVGAFRNGILGAEAVQRFLELCTRWVSFQHPDYHQRVRERERALVSAMLSSMVDESLLRIIPRLESAFRRPRVGSLAPFLSDQLAKLRVRACRKILRHFEHNRHIGSLNEASEGVISDLLFAEGSPLFKDAGLRAQLFDVLCRAREEVRVQENAIDVLIGLEQVLQGNSGLLRSEDMVRDEEVIGRLWQAATARRLQPRFSGSLLQVRSRLSKGGIREESMPLPVWLEGKNGSIEDKPESMAENEY